MKIGHLNEMSSQNNKKNKLIINKKKVIKAIKNSVLKKKKNNKAMNAQRVRGRGDYSLSDFWNDVKKPFTDTTKSVGNLNKSARGLGYNIGKELTGSSSVGTALGNAGSWLSRAFGFGDYSIRSNTLTSGANIAQFKAHGTIEFAHREFVLDLDSTTGFTNSGYLINPGNSTLFPFLSTLAKNFEQYEFLGLIFEFKSSSASAVGSVNTGLGTVIMATDYDVLDAPYVDKRSMEVSEFSTSSAPCNDQIHPIECDPKQNVMRQMFIQSGNTVASYPDDARFSAMGNFQLATSGMQGVSTIGELWVSYHVRLLKPQLETEPTGNPTSMHIKVVGEDASAPDLAAVITNNPGAITASITGNRLLLTCLTAKGLGAYVLGLGIISSNSLGVITAPLSGTSVPVLSGATFVANAYDIIIGPPRNASWSNAAGTDATGTSHQTYNDTSQLYVIKFNALGNTVSLPIYNTAAVTLFHDYYLATYTTPGLGVKQRPTQGDEKYEEIKRLIMEMKINQDRTQSEFIQLKNELTDETGEYEMSTPTKSSSSSTTQDTTLRFAPPVVYSNHRRNAQTFLSSST